MIATQENLKAGHIKLTREILGREYDAYKEIHNAIVANEGEDNEYVVFITVDEKAIKELPSEDHVFKMKTTADEYEKGLTDRDVAYEQDDLDKANDIEMELRELGGEMGDFIQKSFLTELISSSPEMVEDASFVESCKP